MLLPEMWLRKRRLAGALRNYPVYDPPHKVEERLLPMEKAAENFEYFMRVRSQRVEHFQSWLRDNFGANPESNETGVKALNRWGNKYAGLLLVRRPPESPTHCYFTYNPAWTGDNVGCNVVFDMGITLGEFIIAACPRLYWDFDPISKVQPRQARLLKQTPGMSFQRPMLTGFANPIAGKIPLHDLYIFASSMRDYRTTSDGIARFRKIGPEDQRIILNNIINDYKAAIRDYPAGDPWRLREQIPPGKYLDAMDAPIEDEDDHNE